MKGNYNFLHTQGHIEVYKNGEFVLSADTLKEAYEFIEQEEENA